MTDPFFKLIGGRSEVTDSAGKMLQGIGHDLRDVEADVSVGGVVSVTGIHVDNTDPSNPVINPSASVFLVSTTENPVSTDSLAPSFLLGMGVEHSDGITLVDPLTGALRNDTGRTITMAGSISYNPEKISGVVARLNIVSERSNEGTNWFGNLSSRRSVEVGNTGESFGTKVSLIIDWLPDQLLRFRTWTSIGEIKFVSTSETALGQTFAAPSVVWELLEI